MNPHTTKHREQKNFDDKKKTAKSVPTYTHIAYVSFKESKKIYTFGSNHGDWKVNDYVVVETVRGMELGRIVKECEVFLADQGKGMEMKPVLRKATVQDIQASKDNVEKAKDALKICARYIKQLDLDMNLIEAEYTLDCSKIIFVYVADERVDFRELLKELAAQFKCRIELRQIGPRNKSKIVGGLGMCGMETCCSRFLHDFDVVSINMAKNQLLALNIQKLSGQCGKLMCCLKYEDKQYKVLREGLPKLNSQIEYQGRKYRVTSMNVLLQQAKIENKEDVQFLDFKELWPDLDFSNR
ncbi:MAG: stage 0 sporulation protein [Erysipelotrichaceae bacterium]|nr:stage 0 sporulation protein [Erysipelotrichaceae bacterium]MCI9524584.1 stage 0 sporulation protein [Erysipelotrichaceae bacterium]